MHTNLTGRYSSDEIDEFGAKGELYVCPFCDYHGHVDDFGDQCPTCDADLTEDDLSALMPSENANHG
jgi:rubrerythrin